MNDFDYQYKQMVLDIMSQPFTRPNRTGVSTASVFGRTLRFKLNNSLIPLITLKSVHFKSVATELLWFLKGDTNLKFLKENNVRIWDEWADENGNLGPIYGAQLRNFDGVDQLRYIENLLESDPFSRRMVVSFWNPKYLPDTGKSFSDNIKQGKQALAPCHYSFELYCSENTSLTKDQFPLKLSLKVNQRSADVFLGVPFNIASYGLLLRMLAHSNNMYADELIWSGTDCHLYSNHLEACQELVLRDSIGEPAKLSFSRHYDNVDGYKLSDFVVTGYSPHPALKVKVAV